MVERKGLTSKEPKMKSGEEPFAAFLRRALLLTMPMAKFQEALECDCAWGGSALLAALGLLTILLPAWYARPTLNIMVMTAMFHWTWTCTGHWNPSDHIGFGIAAWSSCLLVRFVVHGMVAVMRMAGLAD